MSKSILIVEDEQILRESLAELFSAEGFEVLQAGDGKQARELALQRNVDVVLSDVRMPEMDGLTLLQHLKQIAPETPVILVTAFATVDHAVAAMRAGAADYVLKPVQMDEILLRIDRAMQLREIVRNRTLLTDQMAEDATFHNLVGKSAAMAKLFEMVKKLSKVKSNVLIAGESGTGKELFAKALHYNGPMRNKPFIAVNCGAIPQTLIESELFGYRRGAFTGAIRDKVGYFEAANGGTLFLDEISTLPVGVQSSLLRVLEERVVVPVGDTQPRPIDVRIVAASNRDLGKMVAAGEFREDLLFRLNVVTLQLPPLRSRKEDIPLLVEHFLSRYTQQMNKQVPGVTNGAMRALLNHQWRGNVRELENVIERAVIFADDRPISVQDLPFAPENASDEVGDDLKNALHEFERQHIITSLRRHKYDKQETAKSLGIGVSSLYRKFEELGISKTLEEEDQARQAAEGHA
jgi:two-component system response regulator PilR (NtrC family)